MTIINGAEYYQPIVSIRAEDDGPVVEYKDSPLISDEFWQALTSWDATDEKDSVVLSDVQQAVRDLAGHLDVDDPENWEMVLNAEAFLMWLTNFFARNGFNADDAVGIRVEA